MRGISIDGFIELILIDGSEALFFKYLIYFNQTKTQDEANSTFYEILGRQLIPPLT